MAASTLSTVAFIYKNLYAGRPIGDSAARKHPTWSKVGKKGKFTGNGSFYYPVRYGNPQGVSATFNGSGNASGARQAASSSKGVQFAATRKKKYGYITLDGEAMAAAEDDEGAFTELVTTETDGVLEEMVDSMSFDLFRDGTGVRGRRLSASTNVITLTVADDARNFKVGMLVVASSTTASGGLRVGSTTVAAVGEDASASVTLTSAAAITAFADNDYLFRAGDVGACCEGLASLFPLTAPVAGADSFRGVDRGVDPVRLAGTRVDDTGSVIEDNLGLVAVRISQRNKTATHAVCNPIKLWEISRRTNTKVEYEAGGEATIFFQFIMLATPAGVLKVYADADCPIDRAYVLNMDTLYIKHLKGLPHIVTDDGKDSLRLTDEDSIEARARAWFNLICTDPAANGVCSFAA